MARSAHRLLLSRVGMGSSEAGRSRGLPAPGLGRRGGVLPVWLPNSRGTADSAHECFVPLCLALSSVTSPRVDIAGAGRAAGGGAQQAPQSWSEAAPSRHQTTTSLKSRQDRVTHPPLTDLPPLGPSLRGGTPSSLPRSPYGPPRSLEVCFPDRECVRLI